MSERRDDLDDLAEDGVFHVISAHDMAPKWHLYPVYVALCGEEVETDSPGGD